VVDATPVAMKVFEPLQPPGARVPSPRGTECAGEREVPVTEPEPANAEEPQENPIGRLRSCAFHPSSLLLACLLMG
jgi:hypothetical protein